MRRTDGRMQHLLTRFNSALCQPLQIFQIDSTCSMTFPLCKLDGDYFEAIQKY